MRPAILFALLFIASAAACAAPGNESPLKHDWRQEQGDHEIVFTSKYPAPVPFSTTGEPEARMTMEASVAPKDADLKKIMDAEIADIRSSLMIGDYMEDDGHQPDNGIVSYIEEIDGKPVAFIKYRVTGANGKELDHPRSVIHAILLKNGKVFFVHLIVLYAGHQDEVRGDQIRLVRAIIRH